MLCPVLDSAKTSVNLSEFSKRPSRWLGLGALALQGEVEGTGLVHPGEEIHWSSCLTPTGRLLRRWSHALCSDVYWENKRQ